MVNGLSDVSLLPVKSNASFGTPTSGSNRSAGKSSIAVCRMLIVNRSPTPRSRPENICRSTNFNFDPVMATDSNLGPQVSTIGPTNLEPFT